MRGNEDYKYIQAFDNCAKHIELVSTEVPAIKFSFGGNSSPRFTIGAFSHKSHSFEKEDALDKIDKTADFVSKITFRILVEIC
jgi:hypothetical protein